MKGLSIAQNLAVVRRRIEESACRVGRDPGEVRLIAVTKGVEPARIQEVLGAGIASLGENRVQEIMAKHVLVGPGAEWHFIGRLQTNKVRRLLAEVPVSLIHSLDRPGLAEALDQEARRIGRVQPVLVQVNVSGEATKGGVAPDDLIPFLRWVAGLPGIAVRGLMTMAPACRDPEDARLYFRRLREQAVAAGSAGIDGIGMEHLSMGMSDDYPIAVEEGATIVRVGRAIFEEGERRVG